LNLRLAVAACPFPTAEDRKFVMAVDVAGFSDKWIATAMRMSEESFRTFEPSRNRGRAKLGDVPRSLASWNGHAGNSTACIWITKTRFVWREQPHQVEVSGRAGGLIEVAQKPVFGVADNSVGQAKKTVLPPLWLQT
jgi:hypothetical protein